MLIFTLPLVSQSMSLHPIEIQRILHDHLILVHGNPFDYSYGWDLESFGQVHDVDLKTSVHGEIFVICIVKVRISFNKSRSGEAQPLPPPRNFAGSSQDYPEEEHPPLTAISLPAS